MQLNRGVLARLPGCINLTFRQVAQGYPFGGHIRSSVVIREPKDETSCRRSCGQARASSPLDGRHDAAAARGACRYQVPADPEVRDRHEPDQRLAALGYLCRVGCAGRRSSSKGLGEAGEDARSHRCPGTSSPTRRRLSWSGRTTPSRRRSAAACSNWPGCSATPPDPCRRRIRRTSAFGKLLRFCRR